MILIYMYVLPDDYVCDQEIPRKSQDTIVNSNGYLLLVFLNSPGFALQTGEYVKIKMLVL